jgi:MFS family permease
LRSILTPPLLKWYLIVFVFWLGNSADGFLLLKAASVMGGESKLGAALWQMPLLAFVMSAVAAVFSSHAGAASDTLGRRRVLLLGWLLYAACYAGFAFARAPWVFYVLFGVYGLYYALTGGVERALVSDLTPKGARGTALGAYQCVAGVAALAASVICGWLWGIEVIGGPKAALGFGALCSLAAAALLLILNPMGARPTRAEKSP